ncbi:MAG: sugar ABC transporter permease [Candidatus Cloacimonetes bacterium]|nr:sugar ABC transporter permease [Candidatus Cloacimonadota bacterium]MCF7813196.1 sugar ABC transporter permease [Candidatus Cloacimonadota bacterium]MCF7867644.1 sugar ABC transporter permease [Candidatus Cloacimonadota bacterium]MCF7883081.1 sugar ABC transporter permease [Candidatus Cloacimonadota bacterium]
MKKKKFDFGPYLYLLPAFIIILVFRLIPIVLSFIVSFFEWTVTGAGDFIGFDNYVHMMHDKEFWQSLVNTFYLVIFVVPISLVLSLFFANLLNGIKKLKSFFRSVYFVPTVTSMVAISIVWKIIFNQQSGLANYFLEKIGLDPLGWLAESRGIFQLLFGSMGIEIPTWAGGPSLALFSIIIVTIWKGLGYNTIIYLAGLQNIPNVYYEAADIDGAGKIKQFFRITWPLISPTTYYVLMMTTIVTFQVFSQIYLMTGPPVGGPLGTTKVIVYFLFDKGFGESNNLSYASAIALVLFAIILGLTMLQKKLEKKVHY